MLNNFIDFIRSDFFWIYVLIFFVISYLILSLLTFSFKKSLLYLGIPTSIVGLLLSIGYIVLKIMILFMDSKVEFMKDLIPKLIRPILNNGLLCLGVGVVLIVLNIILNKIFKKKEENKIEQ